MNKGFLIQALILVIKISSMYRKTPPDGLFQTKQTWLCLAWLVNGYANSSSFLSEMKFPKWLVVKCISCAVKYLGQSLPFFHIEVQVRISYFFKYY